MPSAVCVEKALRIYMVPKSKSGALARTNFVWTLWEYVEEVFI